MVDNVSVSGDPTSGSRAAGFAGLGGTVLLGVSLLLPGAPPRTAEPAGQIVTFALSHRSALLVGSFVAALATLALLWFIAGAWRLLHDVALETVLVAGVLAGVVGLVFVLGGIVIVSGLVLEAARSHDLVLVRVVTDTSNIAIQIGMVALSGFAVAMTLVAHAQRRLPRWLVALAVLAWVIVWATSLAALLVQSGPWQFGDAGSLAGTVPLITWFVGFALLMVRTDGSHRATRTATAIA